LTSVTLHYLKIAIGDNKSFRIVTWHLTETRLLRFNNGFL